jgi:hypothetical protein
MTISLSVLFRPVLGLAEQVADHGDGGPGDLGGPGVGEAVIDAGELVPGDRTPLARRSSVRAFISCRSVAYSAVRISVRGSSARQCLAGEASGR